MAEKSSFSPQDLFGVVVRSFGLYFLGEAGLYFISGMTARGSEYSGLRENSPIVFFYLLAGLFLLTQANFVIRYAYPEPKDVIRLDPSQDTPQSPQ